MPQMLTRRVTRALSIAVLLAVPMTAIAQATLGSLTGVVRDASDAVLPGADVTLTSVATAATQAVVTNEIGAFTFPQLPAGTYRVSISLPGFKTQTYNEIV